MVHLFISRIFSLCQSFWLSTWLPVSMWQAIFQEYVCLLASYIQHKSSVNVISSLSYVQLPGETEFYTASVNSNDIWITLTAFELLKMRVLLDPKINGWKTSDRYSVLQTYGSLQDLQPSLWFKMCSYIHFRYRKPIERNCKSDIAILLQWLDLGRSCGDIILMLIAIVTPAVQRRKCIHKNKKNCLLICFSLPV